MAVGSLTPGIRVKLEGGNQLQKVVLCPAYFCRGVYTGTWY